MKKRQGGFLIARIHYLAGRILAKKLKEYELQEINPGQGRILFALWQKDNISIQELSKKTSLGKSTLTHMLDRLEKDGFIIRVPSADDRRMTMVRLTGKNKRLQTAYDRVSEDMTKLFYEGFETQEIEEFEEYLKRILDNLRRGHR